ncbi:MAG: hypothetical protein R3F35_11560 [Myxococcota bacterium]
MDEAKRTNRVGAPVRVGRGLALMLLIGLVLGAGPALAHGPTVEIRASGLSPALLNLFEGTTVHFANTIDAPAGIVVLIDETGDLRSPVLKRPGDGWHYTFDRTGRFDVRVEGRPDWRMTIVVIAKPSGGG